MPTSHTLLPASPPTAALKTHSAFRPRPQRSTGGDVRQATYLDFHEVSHRLERPSSQITGGIPDDTAKVPHALRHGIPCTHIDRALKSLGEFLMILARFPMHSVIAFPAHTHTHTGLALKSLGEFLMLLPRFPMHSVITFPAHTRRPSSQNNHWESS